MDHRCYSIRAYTHANNKQKKKKKKAKKAAKETEDDCFVCGAGGDLMICDIKSCPKTYHPQCLGRYGLEYRVSGV